MESSADGGVVEDSPYRGEVGGIRFKPMPGKVVVKVVGDSEFIGTSKLILSPASRENPRTTGQVIAVYEPFLTGDGETEATPYVQKGDLVIFGKFTGTDVQIGREKVIVLKEADILSIVDVQGDPEEELQRVEAER